MTRTSFPQHVDSSDGIRVDASRLLSRTEFRLSRNPKRGFPDLEPVGAPAGHCYSASMRRFWIPPLFSLWVLGCGSDEAIQGPSPPGGPTGTVSNSALPERLDICGAFWSLLNAPGTAERLCALQTDNPRQRAAIGQCKLCAASLTFVERLLPDPVCYTTVEECPVANIDLVSCFQTVGEILAATVPNCDSPDVTPVNTTQLAVTITGSSCGPVITKCQPMQELIGGLIGAVL